MKKLHIPGVWAAVLLLYVISVLISPNMLSWLQIYNLLKVSAFLGIAALGQTFVLLTGGLDLSVAGLITGTNILCCLLMGGEVSLPVQIAAVVLPLLVAALAGVFKGLLVAKLKILPMIATLSLNYILQGGALLLTNGVSKGRVTKGFARLSEQSLFGVLPYTFAVMLVLAAVLIFLQSKARFGKELFATGSNLTAAYYNGVSSTRTIVCAYVICSVCASISGLLLSSYIELPSYDLGEPYSINSIAACVIGGTLMCGGVGSVAGSFGGAIFITLLNSLLNVMKMPVGVQYVIRGGIIILGILGAGNLKEGIRKCFPKHGAKNAFAK